MVCRFKTANTVTILVHARDHHTGCGPPKRLHISLRQSAHLLHKPWTKRSTDQEPTPRRGVLVEKLTVAERVKKFEVLCNHIYGNDVNLLGESIHTGRKNTEALLVASREIGVGVNAQETESMSTYREQNAGKNPLKSVAKFKYLWTTLTTSKLIFMKKLTLIVLMWRIGWAHNNARKLRIGRWDVFVTVHPWYNYINNQPDATITVY